MGAKILKAPPKICRSAHAYEYGSQRKINKKVKLCGYIIFTYL